MQQRVETFVDKESLSRAAARELVSTVVRVVEQQGRCSLVLSGGSSPGRLYELLSESPFKSQVDWAQLHVFWSDERCVPRDDPRSNYYSARTSLLQHVPMPPGNIHRMPGELDPQLAALTCVEDIRSFFGKQFFGPGSFPSFDIVLLGMGADGHIASLFPGDTRVLQEEELVLATRAPKGMPVTQRLSMNLPLLAAAQNIFFIVCGRDKQPVVERVLCGSADVQHYPASMLCARRRAVWFVAA